MKEVESQSLWVGKIITCNTCLRSYKIESGDIIHSAMMSGRHGSRPAGFSMPCDHYYAIPNDKYDFNGRVK